jgi:uncharacterized protein HemY
MIEIQGLSPKQMALADIMWAISSKEGVDAFIATLPRAERIECEIVKEMILLAFIDQCDNTQEADRVIKQLIDKK